MSLFSQEKIRQHTVTKGETISEIAKKYNVNPSAIYELNPDAVNGIQLKSVLLIPAATKNTTRVAVSESKHSFPEITHEVLAKETLYGITKQYKISLEELYKINPNLEKEGLKIGQTIQIPQVASEDFTAIKEPEKTIEVKKINPPQQKIPKEEIAAVSKGNDEIGVPTESVEHEVLPKESLYSIAKLYKISVSDLQKANPELGNKTLKVGQRIRIPANTEINSSVVAEKKGVTTEKDFNTSQQRNEQAKESSVLSQSVVVKKEQEIKNTIPVASPVRTDNDKETTATFHDVLPKESLYSIAKLYKISLADLEKGNPELEHKSLKAGQRISIPANAEISSSFVNEKKGVTTKKDSNTAQQLEEQTKQSSVLPQSVVVKKEPQTAATIHEVLPKESLYSIAKLYKISLADLKKANPELEHKSLKVGQKISIPVNAEINSSLVADKKDQETGKTIPEVSSSTIENNNGITEYIHEVLPKETKYGIAKEYGISVAELEKQNPNNAKKLLVGSILKISSSKIIDVKPSPVEEIIATGGESNKINDTISQVNSDYDAAFVDHLIASASENMGTRYRSGGTTKEGFDCSGLMCYAFGANDIKLPRSSMEMASYGSVVDAQNARKGDLIFFKTSGRGRITHVGMVVEVVDGEIKFIHSSNHGGVIISSTKESYYEKRMVQVNRVL